MKLFSYFSTILFLWILNPTYAFDSNNVIFENPTINGQLSELVVEIAFVKRQYEIEANILYTELYQVNASLRNAKKIEAQVHLLLKKDAIKERIS